MSEQNEPERGTPSERDQVLATMTNAIGHAWLSVMRGDDSGTLVLTDQETGAAEVAAERVLGELEELGIIDLGGGTPSVTTDRIEENLEALGMGKPDLLTGMSKSERRDLQRDARMETGEFDFESSVCQLHNLEEPCDKCQAAAMIEGPRHHPAVEHLLDFFAYAHLPGPLADVSKPFAIMAKALAANAEWEVEELEEASSLSTTIGLLASARLSGNPELTVALRKLLEAKDAAVRAHKVEIDKQARRFTEVSDTAGGTA